MLAGAPGVRKRQRNQEKRLWGNKVSSKEKTLFLGIDPKQLRRDSGKSLTGVSSTQ
jgi:hypothetical protein